MKFEEAVKTKAQPYGFTADELAGAIDKFSKLNPKLADDNVDEETLNSSVDVVMGFLKMSQEHSDSVISRNSKALKQELETLKADYEALKNKDADGGGKKDKPVENEEMNAMKEQMKSLQNTIDAMNRKQVSNDRKSRLESILADSDEDFKELTLKNYKRMSFASEDEYNEFLEEVKEDAKKNAQRMADAGLKYLRAKGGRADGGDTLSKSEQDYLASKKKELHK